MEANNAQAMREALLALKELDFNKEEDCHDFYRIIDEALAAPPRNCDRFMNADEALEALEKHCNSSDNGCIRCPVAGSTTEEVECKTAWLFAPANEKGENDGK